MAQTQLYAKKSQLHIVAETTTDTFLAPAGAGANMVLVEGISYQRNSEQRSTNYHRPDFLSADEIPGATSATLTFSWPLRGSGVAGTAPQIGNALKACGMKETTVGGTSVTYAPISTFDGSGGNPASSYSLSWLMNGKRYAMKGAFGSFKLMGEVSGFARLDFSFQGAYVAAADDALESPTYQTALAQRFTGASFSTNFGGVYVPKGVRTFEMDLGNAIVIGQDINESSGIYGSRIVARRSFGMFDCEDVLAATKDWDAIREAGTAGTLTTGTIGSTAGNRWRCNVNRATLRPVEQDAPIDNVARLRLSYAVSSAGTDVEGTNNDVELIFT